MLVFVLAASCLLSVVACLLFACCLFVVCLLFVLCCLLIVFVAAGCWFVRRRTAQFESALNSLKAQGSVRRCKGQFEGANRL